MSNASDNFTVCIDKIRDVLYKYVDNEDTINSVLTGVTLVIGEYGIAEIKDISDRIHRTFEEMNDEQRNDQPK